MLLRPLPYEQPERLALIWNRMANTGSSRKVPVAAPDVADFRQRARSFQAIAFTNRISDASLTGGDTPEHVRMGMVTHNFFEVLGVQPQLGRGLPIYNVQMMDGLISDSLAPRWFALTLMVAFAALGIGLAAVGLYGVISYSVGERTREFGVRIALGARPGDLVRQVLRRGMAMVTIGLAVGFVLSAVGSKAMESLLFQVATLDLGVYAAVGSILAAVAALASYIPARRASRIEQVEALRHE